MQNKLPVIAFLALLLSGCQTESATVSRPSATPLPTPGAIAEASTTLGEVKPEEVIAAFAQAGLPVSNPIQYNAENDPNKLLGRPNQYTAKANWADKRIKQRDKSDPQGGTIELFSNAEDMEARYKWVELAGKTMPEAVRYQVKHKNVLLRLARELTPAQAAEYEKVLKGL